MPPTAGRPGVRTGHVRGGGQHVQETQLRPLHLELREHHPAGEPRFRVELGGRRQAAGERRDPPRHRRQGDTAEGERSPLAAGQQGEQRLEQRELRAEVLHHRAARHEPRHPPEVRRREVCEDRAAEGQLEQHHLALGEPVIKHCHSLSLTAIP
jgi:hypothetical protein